MLAGEGRDTVGYNEANWRVSRFMHSPERSAAQLVQVAVLGKMLGGGSRLRPSIDTTLEAALLLPLFSL
ncbi:hypothetical protein NL676_005066 [Syzygium grande]|nr:hypothetical protein NL676_005066 [Syzygium grande]